MSMNKESQPFSRNEYIEKLSKNKILVEKSDTSFIPVNSNMVFEYDFTDSIDSPDLIISVEDNTELKVLKRMKSSEIEGLDETNFNMKYYFLYNDVEYIMNMLFSESIELTGKNETALTFSFDVRASKEKEISDLAPISASIANNYKTTGGGRNG